MRRWYVVQTQVNSEMKAAAHLKRQGFEVYVPQYLKRRRHARRIESVARPLFPRYIFVAVDVAAQRWRSIKSTIGVSCLVCNGDLPAAVPTGVLSEIRAREDGEGFVSVVQHSRFAPGQQVRITDGVFVACQALFERAIDSERVAILLELLGRKLRVVVSGDVVAAA